MRDQYEIHVDDIGTILIGTFLDDGEPVDVSAASTKQIVLQPPTGDKVTKTAVFVNDGTDGKVQYTTVDGDLSVAGVWQLQGHVVLPSGEWSSKIVTFRVYPNL